MDALLLPFLNAKDESESQQHLQLLLTGSAEPLLRAIVKRQLHSSPVNRSAGDALPGDDDVCGEALLQLLTRLRELKANPYQKPIEDFLGYVAVVGFNTCHGHIRQKYPRRYRLKNRLRYLLRHDQNFALWETNDESVCGFARWKNRSPREGARRLDELRRGGSAFDESELASRELERMDLGELVDVVFESVGHPVELDELVNAIAVWKGIREDKVDSVSESAEGASDRLADCRVPLDVEVEQRIYVQRLWTEICQLPKRQRAALLLNLKDGQGCDCIALFPISGIASLRDIATVLEIPAQQFAEMWNELPLDDNNIASRLGITRQQVINLRKSARERLARRMKASEGI
jgi:hypothetical protein